MEEAITGNIGVSHAELRQQHIALRERVIAIEVSMNSHMKNIYDKLDEFGARPSWVVVTIISFLSSSVVGLLVAFLKAGAH